MAHLNYHAEWHGEINAGIYSGYEDVCIELKYTDAVDEDAIRFFRNVLVDYFDGAKVEFVSQMSSEGKMQVGPGFGK